MNYQEAKDALEKLQGKMDSSFSNADKRKIEELYFEVLRKTFVHTSCQQCYHDAVIEMTVYLRKNRKLRTKCKYRMRAGFIISCPDFYGGKIFTNSNLTDKVAREYLEQYPKQEVMFDEIPEEEKTEVKFNPDGTPIDAGTDSGEGKKPTDDAGTGSGDDGKKADKKKADDTTESASNDDGGSNNDETPANDDEDE